jgi:phosphate transport system substrate-binding protein
VGTSVGASVEERQMRRRETAAVLAYLLLVGATGLAMWLAVRFEDARRPSVGPASAPAPPTDGAGGDETLSAAPRFAGSGTPIPVLELLARQLERSEGIRVSIAPSIGSTGGLAALRKGRIDCALVSRPLRTGEGEGFEVLPFARAPVVLAAGRDLPVRDLTSAELLELYSGRTRIWADGREVVLFLRESGDSATQVFAERFDGFGSTHAQAAADGTWRLVLTDVEMERALADSPRGLGLFDYGTIGLHGLMLRIVPVEGLAPDSPGGVPEQYPLTRPLTFVCRRPLAGQTAKFIRFVQGPEGRRLLRQHGYLSPEEQP